jgi:hypothetical protein
MKSTQGHQGSSRKLQLQLALTAALFYLLVSFDTGAAAATTNSQSAISGANRPSRYPPGWATTNQSRTASRLAWLAAQKTNAHSASIAGPAPRPANQRAVLVEIGPNHRGLKAESDTSAGAVSNRLTLARQIGKSPVVAIETGMNYWDGQQWSPSEARFDLTEDAFVANRIQHRTRLNADLNAIGAVTTTLVDGTTLRSTPVAIGLYDPNNGRFAVIATVTNSVGMLVATNQVVYPNAFSGSVCANVVYTLNKGSFEQDVVITGRLNPVDYSFPTNAQIQIITEFYDPPQPEKMRRPIYVEQTQAVRRRMVSPDLMDEVLGFSELVIGTGRAFAAPSATHTNGAQAVVGKEFRTVPEEGRTFLIETVNCLPLQNALNALPECGGGSGTAQLIRSGKALAGYALIPRLGQGARAKAKPRKPPYQVAQANIPACSGVTIDYIATLSGSLSGTTVFKADTTYLVEGTVYCNGPVTLEAAVFKYKIGATIKLNNSLTCKTSSYRPAVFTCIDDDSIGQSMGYYDTAWTGNINPAGYANPALWAYWLSVPNVSNVRFCYAQEALRLEGGQVTATLAHAQILKCIRGIVLVTAAAGTGSGGSGWFSLTVNNALLSFVDSALVRSVEYGSGYSPQASPYLYHCTIDHTQVLANDATSAPDFAVQFRNCALANIGSLGNAVLTSSAYNGFFSCPLFGSPASQWNLGNLPANSPFQAAGGGGYYLKADSVFRGKGATTGLPYTLLPSLMTKTTQPPIAFPHLMEVTGDLALFPQIPRYVSGPPDLGYWYDALDYTMAWMTSFGTITVMPGTAIGFRNEYAPEAGRWTLWGIDLREGSSFISHGTPPKPNILTDVQLVHEQEPSPCWASFLLDFFPTDASVPPPSLDFRFSSFYANPECCHFWGGYDEGFLEYAPSPDSLVNLSLRDCSLCGGRINLGNPDDGFYFGAPWDFVYGSGSVSWFNNSFDRVNINLEPTYYWLDLTTVNCNMQVQAYNNLFRGGRWFHISPCPTTPAGNWVFKDNLFDKVDLVQEVVAPLDYDYNAYWPLTQSELNAMYPWNPPWWAANAGQLQPTTPVDDLNGGNEQSLPAAPVYQTGPFGDYYLATSSPLYNTANRGSRSVADAGLYHYTTRYDQTKDGAQTGNVIIGRHYIATASYSSTQPKDSDTGGGDGIPDYVENWHGDGNYHSDTETKWQENYTTPGVEDKNNSVYQNIDLDGDGMVGLIETALSKNPLVPDNTLTLTLAASPGPNRMAFVVPVPFSTLAGIGSLSLHLDGRPVPFVRWDQDTSGGCLLTWDTSYELPGNHFAQVELFLNGQTRPGAMGPLNPLTVGVDQLPYLYPLVPGTSDWPNATPSDRLAYAAIPQQWQTTATSWQLFSSAIANPYFRGISAVGGSMSSSYDAAKIGTVAVLSTVEQSTDFGVNCLRYLCSLDVPTMASTACSDWSGPCWLEYAVVCHMAGLNASLTTLDQTSLQRLFRIAVWDANYFISSGDTMVATAPVCLMYAIYKLSETSRGPFPAGLTLPDLNWYQTSQLDRGDLPAELGASVSTAQTVLGLTSRP